MVKIKMEYNGEIRLLSLNQPQNLFNQLLVKVREITGVRHSIPKLLFEDPDSDTIRILSTSDLDHCITVHAQFCGEIPKIRVVYTTMGKPSQVVSNVLGLIDSCLDIFRRGKRCRIICFLIALGTVIVVLLQREKLLYRDHDTPNSYSFLNDTVTNNTVLIFLPASDARAPLRDTCKQCVVPENYSDSCIEYLNGEALHFNAQRKEVIAKAKKQPTEKERYPPITGFLNMVIDADTYTWGPLKRGDPISDIQLQTIRESGLLEHAALRVRVGILTKSTTEPTLVDKAKWVVEDAVERLTCDAKHPVTIEYWEPSNDPSMFECETINMVRKWCTAPHRRGSFVFYLHNKGKNREQNSRNYGNIRDWRSYMMYFLFERWELCANTLSQGIPTCGVDLRMDATGEFPHYSGNYWWARCDWISKIDRVCRNGEPNNSRFWLLQNRAGNIGHEEQGIGRSLWNSDIDHYHRPFPRSTYNCVDQINEKGERINIS